MINLSELKIGKLYFYKFGSVIKKGELKEVSLTSQGWKFNISNNWHRLITDSVEELKAGYIQMFIADRDKTLKELDARKSKAIEDHDLAMTELLDTFRKHKAENGG